MEEKEICLRLQQELSAFIQHMSVNLPGDGIRLNQITEQVVNNMQDVERYKVKAFFTALQSPFKILKRCDYCNSMVRQKGVKS